MCVCYYDVSSILYVNLYCRYEYLQSVTSQIKPVLLTIQCFALVRTDLLGAEGESDLGVTETDGLLEGSGECDRLLGGSQKHEIEREPHAGVHFGSDQTVHYHHSLAREVQLTVRQKLHRRLARSWWIASTGAACRSGLRRR